MHCFTTSSGNQNIFPGLKFSIREMIASHTATKSTRDYPIPCPVPLQINWSEPSKLLCWDCHKVCTKTFAAATPSSSLIETIAAMLSIIYSQQLMTLFYAWKNFCCITCWQSQLICEVNLHLWGEHKQIRKRKYQFIWKNMFLEQTVITPISEYV